MTNVDAIIEAIHRFGRVEIVTEPEGATIENSPLGFFKVCETNRTPESGYVLQGEVTFMLKKDGYKPMEVKETVESGIVNTFQYKLEPLE